jgi:phage FluMu gp28-like protein
VFTKEQRLAFCDAYIKYGDTPIQLDRWQELYVSDASRFSILLKGRQEGFSFASALKGLVKALDPDRRNYTRQYVSYNFDDAVEKIRAATMLYDSIPKRIKKKLLVRNKTMMEFLDNDGKTTSRLISIACRPPRGRSGDIVLDEFAIYKKNASKTIYTAALPVLSRGGCMEIGSTPLGMLGMFYQIWTDKENFKDFSRFTVPWWQSSALCVDVEAARLADVKSMETEERVTHFGTKTLTDAFNALFFEDFKQEYECTFLDSAESYIAMDLILDNTPGRRDEDWQSMGVTENEGEIDIEVHVFHTADSLCEGYIPEKHGRLFLGYDVARRRDAAVIFVIGVMPDGRKRSVAEIVMVNKDFEYQLDEFRKIMRGLSPVRACIDQTGQGEFVVETVQKEFGNSRVEGVLFNLMSKQELVISVRQGLERMEFLLQNDSRFHKQIHSIKQFPTMGGAFRYDSERDEDGHADSFWAWALANHAVTGPVNTKPGFYEQYRAKRAGIAPETVKQETAATPQVIPARGKTAAAIMREMRKKAGGLV